jgi:hypothetical protein
VLLAVAQKFCIKSELYLTPKPCEVGVDLVGDCIHLCLAVNRQVCSFWQVLANIKLNFRWPLNTMAVRVTKLHRSACVVGQLVVQRHLTTFVVGHYDVHGLCNP